jgi:hippurate hydrolase
VQREVTVIDGFPPTINDARAVATFAAVAGELPGGAFETLPHPIMGAEDFSYVLEKVPGAMAFLGVAAEAATGRAAAASIRAAWWSTRSALPRGAAILAGCALRFLERGWD